MILLCYPMKIIVGLGNPGRKYARIRHNVGFLCVERLARENGISFSKRHRLTLIGEGSIEEETVILAKPRTHVNLSGEAIVYLLARYRIESTDLIIIYDDMDLPLGKIRLRPRGSAGGHKGISSIIDALETEAFPRIKVGIGRPPEGQGGVEYVLGNFSPEEQRIVNETVQNVSESVACLLTEGIEVAMGRYN